VSFYLTFSIKYLRKNIQDSKKKESLKAFMESIATLFTQMGNDNFTPPSDPSLFLSDQTREVREHTNPIGTSDLLEISN
jgi:hypothetical protein